MWLALAYIGSVSPSPSFVSYIPTLIHPIPSRVESNALVAGSKAIGLPLFCDSASCAQKARGESRPDQRGVEIELVERPPVVGLVVVLSASNV